MKSIVEKLNLGDKLVDTHCHLNSVVYDKDRDQLIKNAENAGVQEIWDVGTDIESSKKALENAKNYSNIKAIVGIDPEIFIPSSEMFVGFDKDENWLEQQHDELNLLVAQSPQLIASLGEIGLDHYWTKDLDQESQQKSHRLQEDLFRMHLELAVKHDLTLSIHSRGAEKRCLEIVKEYDCVGIFHSFTSDYKTAKGILDAGWGLGVNGIITFKNAEELRGVYKKILDRRDVRSNISTMSDFYNKGIFFETDAPFLSPDGKRGERNEPANVAIIFNKFVEMLA